MKKNPERFSIPAGRVSAVPEADVERLKKAVRERVIAPMKNRAKQQRDLIAKVRARTVR